ncbi:NAD(P)H-dependent flavin oxidoreductase [Mycetocola saprophilus]|uniref:NAD(P)H-dependent flavin oxidoreductase n=1 Tax=Mycetocola saprophilus TaxID=76636 RepID=UPI003BF4331D
MSAALTQLGFSVPIVAAPMAGGPSTPALVSAVAEAGGLGFVAAGYLSLDALSAQLEQLSGRRFGINIFAPNEADPGIDPAVYAAYREQLLAGGGIDPVLLPETPQQSDDHYAEKVRLALASEAAFVSFTFGYPDPKVIEHLQSAGKRVVLGATSREGIDAVLDTAADVLSIQGPGAGGHRATVLGIDGEDADDQDLRELIRYARSRSDQPIFAGGGIADAADVRDILAAGATAAQVGTLFLGATEAGTKPAHLAALQDLRHRATVLTRAFTGRTARAVSNRFTEAFSDHAPTMYPALHFLTAGVRAQAAAQADPEQLHLWAGAGFEGVRVAPAAEIVTSLTRELPAGS